MHRYTKHQNPCLETCGDDEPIFVLRAQDELAPMLVTLWAYMASLFLGADHPKVIEARDIAKWMTEWPDRSLPD